MHTSLKQYPVFNLPKTMREMTSDLEVEMMLKLGTVKRVMKMLLPMPRWSRWWQWRRFPTSGRSKMSGSDPFGGGRRVLPLPQKIPRKYGVGFLSRWRWS
jgi:hypothetical protein